MLLKIMGESVILKTELEREDYKFVRARLKQEFESERLTWLFDE
jgi:hypothetical protein